MLIRDVVRPSTTRFAARATNGTGAQFHFVKHNGEPAMLTDVDDGRSFGSVWFQEHSHQIFHFGGQLDFDRLLECVVSCHLVLIHLHLVVSIKRVDLIKHNEDHHAQTPEGQWISINVTGKALSMYLPDISSERVVWNVFEHFGRIIACGTAVRVREHHIASLVKVDEATEAKVGDNRVQMGVKKDVVQLKIATREMRSELKVYSLHVALTGGQFCVRECT